MDIKARHLAGFFILENAMPSDLNDEQKARLLEMLDTWDDVHRAIKFLKFLGHAMGWMLGLGASFAIIWGATHGGKTP